MKPSRFGPREIGFTVGGSALFILTRLYNVATLMGSVVTEFIK